MNAQSILSRFDLIADAPGSIQRLRKLVVHLAISGRLIDSRDEERLTGEHLKIIESTKQSLIKKGRIKKPSVIRAIDAIELPAGCHDTSRFQRLQDITMLEKGLTAIQSAMPGDYPLVVTAQARSSADHYDFDGCAAIIPMVSSSGHGSASLKRLHYQEGKFALGNILCAAFPISDELLSARFIFEYLTAFKEELLVSKMIGTANVSLTLAKIGEVPVPIVSPTVQRRVGELMVLCDRLEEAQKEQESHRAQLVAASVYHLNNSADRETFQRHANFYIDHVRRLTANTDQINQLRQTILNLAVRGQLVPQDPSDEPASELLAKKAKLPDDYQRRRKILKKTSIDTPKNLFLKVPKSWEYTDVQTLYDLNVIVDYADGNHGSLYPRSSEFDDSGVAFVTAKDLANGRVLWDSCAKLNEKRANQLTKGWARGGDVLLTHNARVGRVARVDDGVGRFLLGTSVTFYRLNSTVLEPGFFFYVLRSPLWQGQLDAIMAQTTRNQVSIQKQALFRLVVPPLAEQRRIVAKVDELMAVCDRLEAQINTAQTETSRLLESVLHSALQGTVTSDFHGVAPSYSPTPIKAVLTT